MTNDKLMTDEELAKIEVRTYNVKPGPWTLEIDSEARDADFGPIDHWPWRIEGVCNFAEESADFATAEFIENARTDIPRMLEYIWELKRLNAEQDKMLTDLLALHERTAKDAMSSWELCKLALDLVTTKDKK